MHSETVCVCETPKLTNVHLFCDRENELNEDDPRKMFEECSSDTGETTNEVILST